MNKTKRILSLVTVLLTACLGLSACAGSPQNANDTSGSASPVEGSASDQTASDSTSSLPAPVSNAAAGNTITVNSSEQVSVTPDIAEVIYSVRTQSSTASACQQENTEAVSQVITLLTELGVSEGSIQTSDYYMSPVYDYSGSTARVTGYESITSLTVSDLPIDGLSEILSRSVESGVNTIQSITYMASRYDESYQEALKAAVATAFSKAQILAQAAGCQVGNVVSITETSGYSQARYNDEALTNKQRAAATEDLLLTSGDSSIQPGEIDVEASIIVEYTLQ